MDQGPAVRVLYDRIAARYDEATALGGWYPNRVLNEELDERRPVRTACDLACGTGQTATVIRSRYPAAAITAVDASAQMLAAWAGPSARVHLVHADLDAFVRRSSVTFDLVTCVGAIEYQPTGLAVIGNLAGLLAPGGCLAVTYEPIAENQLEPVHELASPNADEPGITLYRLMSNDVAWTLADAGAIMFQQRRFTAYTRYGVPVIYELCLAHRSVRP